MLLTIYDSKGNTRAEIAPNDSSTQQKEVEGDNVLALTFTHYEHIALDVNDYTDYEGERYWLMEKYQPKEVSEGEWEYDVKMYGVESLIKRFLVLETTDGDTEPVFTLTAPPKEHVAMVVKCMNDGLNHTTDWKVGQVDGTDNITIDYEGKFCDEALKEIADAVGGQAEWWIEGQTVNICRCEHGEQLTLAYGKGLTSIERDTSNTEGFYTRLFPIGSSRNIDAETYGYSRLMLPSRKKYVELHTDEYGIYDRYEEDAFADIYPRRTGTISSVRSEEQKDDDGNTFTVYYFKDSALTFDPNDYELAGEVKRVSFQTGELAGLGSDDDHYFEVNYDSDTGEFEIITIWPYDDDTQLPGGSLIPKAGDTYILWNIKMPDEYYTMAEEEFATAVDKYNEEHWQDISVYKAPTDHVWIEDNAVELYIGRRVKLESTEYFAETGYRESRITKLTRKVTLPGQVDLEISDALQTGTMSKLQNDISDVRSYAKSKAESLALPDIIRSWDDTTPTDNNLFSARRSQQEFVSKKKNDRTKGKLTMEGGAVFGQEENATIDAKGNASLLTLIVRELLGSATFTDGLTGEGWQLWMEDALSHLTIDRLTVRQTMTVFELLIDKVRSVGGQICVSAANGKIKEVTDDGSDYIITFETDNTFAENDLIRCQTFTGGTLKSYWVEVRSVESGKVHIAMQDFDEWDCEPEAGDECVLMGNTGNEDRQNLILISATEDGEPRIDVMDGVKSRSFSGCLRARLGNLDGITDSWFPTDNQPHGNGLYADNAYLRGTFLLTTGEDIKTKFEITEGKITAAIEGLRQDFAGDKGYLSNSTFGDGMDKWTTENETVFFLVGNKWVWANSAALSMKGDRANVVTDDGRTVVRIKNKYIRQANANLRSIPTFTTNADGEKEALPVYLSFFYRCATTGTLKVEFENVDKTGFANFDSMEVEEELVATEGYVQYSCNGLWNGTGDFKLSFTGDIYLYMLILSTDKIESLAYKYKTLFEQSERLVKISAAVFDKDENALKETGLFVKPEGAGLYAQDADGNVALIGVSVDETDADGNKKSTIKLTADNIQLEGLVTANGNFKILEDGSIEAVNGKFTGEINATSGYIGGFVIGEGRIGTGSVTTDSDGNMTVTEDNSGLFLYDSMIGFNAKDRQAILGTWNNYGQPMLVRLVDTGSSLLPKYGIVFDIENSSYNNLAFVGTGNGVLNGMIEGYAYTKITLSTANTRYSGYMNLLSANRYIVGCALSGAGVMLPLLSDVRNKLGLSSTSTRPFCVRLTICAEISNTQNFNVYGRNDDQSSEKDTDGDYKKPWNTTSYPLLVNQNGGNQNNVSMGKGDTLEVLLVYDNDRTDTIDSYDTKYTARIINIYS